MSALLSVSGLAVDKALRRFRHQGQDTLLLVEAPGRCSYAKIMMWIGPGLWFLTMVYVVASLIFPIGNWLVVAGGVIAGFASLGVGGWAYVNINAGHGGGAALVFDNVVRKAPAAIWTRESFDALVYTGGVTMPVVVQGCRTSDKVVLTFEWVVNFRVSRPGNLQDSKAVGALDKALVDGFTAMSKEMSGGHKYPEIRDGALTGIDIDLSRFVDLPIVFLGIPGLQVKPPRELADRERKAAEAAKAEKHRVGILSERFRQDIRDARTSADAGVLVVEIDKADLPADVIHELRADALDRQQQLAEAEERAERAERERRAEQALKAQALEAGEAQEAAAGVVRRYRASESELDQAVALMRQDPDKFAIHMFLERIRVAQRQLAVQEAAVKAGVSLPAVDIPPALPASSDRLALTENGLRQLTAGSDRDNGRVEGVAHQDQAEPAAVQAG